MSRFLILAAPFAILVWSVFIVVFVQYSQTEYQQVQERRAEYAVNYSVDAAVDVMVESTADLGMDYADYERITVGPDVALSTFVDVFCKNYGMSLSAGNRAAIKCDYITAFVVAMYDGYYIATPQVINDSGVTDLIFSVKQPYLYQAPTGEVYALNLGKVDAKEFSGTTIRKVDAPITKDEQKFAINAAVTDAFMSAIYEVKGGNIHNVVYLPTEVTNISTTNPVDKITVMAYVADINAGYGGLVEVLGIGGAQVAHTDYCVCYERDGEKLYCYASNLPEGMTVIAFYETPILAAQHGYYFDITTLSR